MKPTTPTMHSTPEPTEPEAQHTAGPWSIQEPQSKLYANDREIVAPYQGKKPNAATSLVAKTSEANAARIVACVNACTGIPDPASAIPALVVALEIAASALSALLDINQSDWERERAKFALDQARYALNLVKGSTAEGGKP